MQKSYIHGHKLGPKLIFSKNLLLDDEQPGNDKFPFPSKSSLIPGLTVLHDIQFCHSLAWFERQEIPYSWPKAGPKYYMHDISTDWFPRKW